MFRRCSSASWTLRWDTGLRPSNAVCLRLGVVDSAASMPKCVADSAALPQDSTQLVMCFCVNSPKIEVADQTCVGSAVACCTMHAVCAHDAPSRRPYASMACDSLPLLGTEYINAHSLSSTALLSRPTRQLLNSSEAADCCL